MVQMHVSALMRVLMCRLQFGDGTELKNLFVFYYPNYNSTSAVHPG